MPGFTEIVAPEQAALSPSLVARRRGNDHRLYAIADKGRVCAYGWVSGPGQEVRVLHALTFTVPPRCIYIWDCLTLPEERNRGRYKALLRGMLSTVPEAGTAYVAVDLGNTASRRALERVGFRPLFKYFGMKLFGSPVFALAYDDGRILRAQSAFDHIGTKAAGMDSVHGNA